MTWTKVTTHNEPVGCFEGDYVSGIYKISEYERCLAEHLGRHFRAYYIRKPDKCWGYYVDPQQPYYRTLKQAQAACERHEKESAK